MKTVRIFDIQRGSYHDGPGIRTTVFLKGCNLRCFWCQNPESQKSADQLLYFSKKCIHCKTCIQTCGAGALSVRQDSICIDYGNCVLCGKCAESCPGKALVKSGDTLELQEILDIVCLDREFYELSGGGITLSGGEPFLQESVLELLQMAKSAGLHTAVETAGNVDSEIICKAAEYTDLFLYDVKCIDSKLHQTGCGVENRRILENLRLLAKKGCRILIRTPVIPGFNDNREELRKIIAYAKKLGLPKPEFLKFNKLGTYKYRALGREYPAACLPLFDREQWEALMDQVENTEKETKDIE